MKFLDVESVLVIHESRIRAAEDDLYDLVIGIAEGRVTKETAAVFFERHA